MEVFLVIAFTHFLALLSPGPDFFLILTSLLHAYSLLIDHLFSYRPDQLKSF